ncbi:MAG: tetratricopeptide repeat protein [Thiobacillus sp.]
MNRILQALLLAIVMTTPVRATNMTAVEANATLTRLNHAIAKSPGLAGLYTERGDIYYQLNDFHRAIENYSAALKRDDKQSRAYFGRGMAYGRMGLMDEGIADLGVYIARHPTDSVAYTKRGVRNIWRGNLQEAERDLARAVELDPANAEAHDDLGVVHAKHNRLSLASEHFVKAIQLDPSYQKAYHNLAICRFMTGELQSALQVVDAGLALDADNRSSMILKSTILQALGRGQEANEILARAEFLPEENWSERSAVGVIKKEK